MHVASRSYLATGVALVSASAIAVSPIAPPVPDIHLPAIHASSATVALSAVTNPLQAWGQVIEASLANVNTLGQRWLDDPTPLLRQILANQLQMATNFPAVAQALVARLGDLNPADPTSVPATIQQFITNEMKSVGILGETFQTVVSQLSALMDPADPFGVPATIRQMSNEIANGQFAQAFTTFAGLGVSIGLPLIMAGFPIAGVISQPFKDLANIIDPTGVASAPLRNIANFIDMIPSVLPSVLLNGVLGPLNSAGVATATSLEELTGALRSADPVTFVSALLNAPAQITGAFLNGTMAPGDFPMAGLIGGPYGISAIGSVMDAIKGLAQAIASPGALVQKQQGSLRNSTPESASVGASPLNSTGSTTVTLDIAPKTGAKDADTVGSPAVATGALPAAPLDTVASDTEASDTEASDTAASDTKPSWNDAVATVTGLVRDSLKAKPGKTGMGTTQPGQAKPADDDVADTDKNVTEGSVTPANSAESATAGEAGAGTGSSASSASASSSPAGGAGGEGA
jgi:hypothetical protein